MGPLVTGIGAVAATVPLAAAHLVGGVWEGLGGRRIGIEGVPAMMSSSVYIIRSGPAERTSMEVREFR